jgi:hypothetical protein
LYEQALVNAVEINLYTPREKELIGGGTQYLRALLLSP